MTDPLGAVYSAWCCVRCRRGTRHDGHDRGDRNDRNDRGVRRKLCLPRLLSRALLATLLLTPPLIAPAQAGQAPALTMRTIRVIVPGAAGAGADALARVFAEAFGKRLNLPVVVENRVGAAGVLGADAVAKAAPDGSMLLFAQQDSQVLLPLLRKNMPYDTFRDFTPIAKLGDNYLILVASPQTGVTSLRQLIELARAKPGGLTFAGAGVGGINQLVSELLMQKAGISMLHVPYKGGAPAATAVMAGEVNLFVGSHTLLGKAIEAGRLQPLAVTRGTRMPLLPEVPTLSESGFPGLVVSSWYGLLGPAGMPAPLVATLTAASLDAAQSPELRKRHEAVGSIGEAADGDALMRFLREDYARWKEVIERARITLD